MTFGIHRESLSYTARTLTPTMSRPLGVLSNVQPAQAQAAECAASAAPGL